MKKFKLQLIAGLAGTLVAVGCGRPAGPSNPGPTDEPTPAQPGNVTVNYVFQGVENPTRVNVLLIDAETAGISCDNIPYNPTSGVIAQQTNLPVQGAAGFNNVAPGDKWLVFSVGFKANGVRVADTCHDQITVRENETSVVDLTLKNRALEVTGSFDTQMKINLDLPTEAVQILMLLDIACQQLLDPSDPICQISSTLVNYLLDLDVDATWVLTQYGDTITANVKWNKVEGHDVGQWDLVSGGFTIEIPGATGLTFKTPDSLEIKLDQLIPFLIQDVMGVNLGQFGSVVGVVLDYLSEDLISDITVVSGQGTATDSTNDGVAESLVGDLECSIEFPVLDYTHDFSMDYNSIRG